MRLSTLFIIAKNNKPLKLSWIFLLSIIISSYNGFANEDNRDVPIQNRNCGIYSLTRVGQIINDPSFDALTLVNNPAIYNMYDLLIGADLLKFEPMALNMTIDELQTITGPAILHLSKKHFVTLQEIKNNHALIYDYKEGEKWISMEELVKEWSGNLICFEVTDKGRNLTVKELKALFGYDSSYHSSYPPGHPVYPDDRDGCDDHKARRSDCNGAPVISVSPVDLNVKVDDIPLWYKAGKGPDISIQIKYKNEASQPDIGIGSANTTFYPFGVNCFFNYSSFYLEKTNNNIMVIMPGGMQLLYTYDAGNYIPPPKYYNTLETSGPGFVLTMKNTKTKYYYTDPNHSKLTAIEDKNGNSLTFFYDGNYNLDYITDANNRIVQFTTDVNGRFTQIQDPLGRTASFEYDVGGYITKITDMSGFESYLTYDVVPAWTGLSAGTKKKLVSVQTPTQLTSFQYEIPAIVGSTIPLYRITLTTADGNSQVYSWAPTFSNTTPTTAITTIEDYNGNLTKYTIDMINDRITKIIYPDIYSTVFYEYDQNGYRNKITQGGFLTAYVYDSKGNLLQETDPRNEVTQFTYDLNDNVETITDPMNRLTTIGYDINNNITSITTPVNSQSFTYYVNGALQSFTDANNNTTTYNYDGNGYVSTVNYPSGSPGSYINDIVGRPNSITVNGVTRNFEYDDLDQITKITYPNGNSITYAYDFKNIIEYKNIEGVVSNFTYDCDNNCLLVHASTPQTDLVYSRDANGNLIALSVNGQVSSYEYDNLDRVINEINPDGTSKRYFYDELDNIVKKIDENGNQTTFIYDYDLLININYSDNTPDVAYAYNANGELIEMTDGIGTSTYQYDDGGRLTNINGTTVDENIVFTYDGMGNQLTMTKTGLNTSYTYDGLNRLSNVVSNYASAAYLYDTNGNMLKKSYGNGAYTDYTYDNLNRINSLTNKTSTDEIISQFVYSFENEVLIKNIVDLHGNISTYEYDDAFQLIHEKVINVEGKTHWDNTFSYDNLGNRIKLTKNGVQDNFIYNVNNQLTSMTKTAINVNGIVEGDSAKNVYVENVKASTSYLGNNLIAFNANDIPLDQSKDSVQIYARVNDILATVGDSAKFQCTTMNMPDGSVNIFLFSDIENVAPENINTVFIKKNTIQYIYNANGNLTQRISSGEITNYTYDAEDRLIRVDLPDGNYEEYEYNGFGQRVKFLKNGNLYQSFIYSNEFEVCAIKDSNGNTTYLTRGQYITAGNGGIINSYKNATSAVYHMYNHRDDIICNIDENDELLYYADYDAFGSQRQTTGENLIDFNYSTKEYNSTTGLVFFGSRYYMEENGRWLTRDPIRFEGGLNIYKFANNNPVNFIDPDGEAVFVIIGIGVGAYFLIRGGIEAYYGAKRAYLRYQGRKQTEEAMRLRPQTSTYRAHGRNIRRGCAATADIIKNIPGTTVTGAPPTSAADLAVGALNAGAAEALNRKNCNKKNRRRRGR